jgi:exonuclease SbcC
VEDAYPDFVPLPVTVQKVNNDIENEWLKLSQDALLSRTEFDKNANEIADCNGFIDAFHHDNPAIDRERTAALCGLSQEQVKAIQDEINLLHSNVTRNEALLAESERKYNELLSLRPAIDEDETAETLAAKRQSAEERRSECDKMVGAYASELKQDEEKAAMLKKEIEEAALLEKEASRWKRLSDIFGSADGGKFKSIAQSYILLQLLENSNFYLRQFTSRYELTTQPGSLVILVNDREDGDTLRAANTLSGGESFMVSLALALGLSSLNRNNFTPDTLFIDEGFGTLSGDCLNTVIETLEVLHNIGSRRVGIISHVGELYERIGTKIEVRKQAGVSEVIITG